MTTIVFDGSTVAWDSRITAGSDIITDSAQKRYKVGGRTFWFCGTVGDMQEFADSYASRETSRELNVGALVLDRDGLFTAGSDSDGRIFRNPVTSPVAMGSGGDYALGAISCGKTAREAVKIATTRDSCSGGRIRVQKL